MDNIMKIKTDGIQTDYKDSYYYHRYEPTPYEILEKLAERIEVNSSDCFVDFGCGMGRMNFYMNYKYRCKSVGIEYNSEYYSIAEKNLKTYIGRGDKIKFENCLAEDYEIKEDENIFYFFNPFSIEIFRRVINNIKSSTYIKPRQTTVILYYPDDEYSFYLDSRGYKLIDMADLGGKDERNCFLIYKNVME